jgi:hypothetical protein
MYFPMDLRPIQNALVRWHSAWAVRSDDVDESKPREDWQDVGFIGNAQEFAWLLLTRLEAPEVSKSLLSEEASLAESRHVCFSWAI